MITYNPDLKIFCSTLINDDRYFSGFSSRDQGDARNIDNIIKYFNQQYISFKRLIILEQIHSTNIEVFQESEYQEQVEKLEDKDGVITNLPEVILIVRNADCVPLVFLDKLKGVIGISHQGWRGSLKKMSIKMVEQMTQLGVEKENLRVAIGPAIGACCYDVDDDRYYSFLQEFDGYSDKIFFKKKGRWHLSLPLLNYLQLLNSGVKKGNIDFFPFCTKCDRKRFFSRRRSKTENFEKMFNFVVKIK
ncbi:peptidoglycan editing factor PgeF [Candidatus Roizmanbacteria bacterium]|nr:peptidoglycan editing factor PgeF [Candidatus Roizmanbacteria bacterium]